MTGVWILGSCKSLDHLELKKTTHTVFILNTFKTKEMIVDYQRYRPPFQPVKVCGLDIEMVTKYKYLGLHLYNKLNWSWIQEPSLSFFFLRKPRSLEICSKLLQMFFQSVALTVLCCTLLLGSQCQKQGCMKTGPTSVSCNCCNLSHTGGDGGKMHTKSTRSHSE